MADQLRITATLHILRRKEVEARTKLSRSTIYARIKAGTFPAPVPLGPKAVGWISSEVDDFIAGCIAQRDSGPRAA